MQLDIIRHVCILKTVSCKEEGEEGRNMMVRVIYSDQTAGVVDNQLLDGLVKKGRVVAYHKEGRWISIEKERYASDCPRPAGSFHQWIPTDTASVDQ
jgi:hypothetical protein